MKVGKILEVWTGLMEGFSTSITKLITGVCALAYLGGDVVSQGLGDCRCRMRNRERMRLGPADS